MFLDARSDAGTASTQYDVAIIGAGPAGITLAQELSGQGLRVALLESGGLEFDGDTQLLYDGTVTGLEETDLTASRLRFFGGTSNHWGGHCLPLDPIDFDRAPLSGLSGWPISRQNLDPYYRKAHEYCDLGSYDYRVATDADELLLAQDDMIETTVIRQSKPTRFGEKYRSQLGSALDVDVLLWANVVHLETNSDGNVQGIHWATLTGQRGVTVARVVVMACGAVENARLLLASNARNGQRLGDAGAFLGACYMDHVAGGAGFLHFAAPVRSKIYWGEHPRGADGVPRHHVWRLRDAVLRREGLANTQFFLLPFSEDADVQAERVAAYRSLDGLKSVAKWALGRDIGDQTLSDSYCSFINDAEALAVKIATDFRGGEQVDRLLLRYEAELQPDKSNRVTLADGQDELGQAQTILHWSPSLFDRDSIVRSTILIGQACGAAELGRVELEDHFDARYWDASTTWHALGTTRIARAPEDGVVTEDLRVHGARNLFIAGGSVMPSGGRANPTLTIVALTIRLGDFLKSELGMLQ